ncbi:MAG: hypothetical protein VKJ24_15825 [Synechococcales bacterium]|nr:hypothetical protein [Synechococcales bacterium]
MPKICSVGDRIFHIYRPFSQWVVHFPNGSSFSQHFPNGSSIFPMGRHFPNIFPMGRPFSQWVVETFRRNVSTTAWWLLWDGGYHGMVVVMGRWLPRHGGCYGTAVTTAWWLLWDGGYHGMAVAIDFGCY